VVPWVASVPLPSPRNQAIIVPAEPVGLKRRGGSPRRSFTIQRVLSNSFKISNFDSFAIQGFYLIFYKIGILAYLIL
jgi:hypothetical protein